jgi:hypothetical protein
VIGGIAAVIHGVPRATFDLDILIEATPENGRRLLGALVEAGLGTASLTDVDSLLRHEITVFKDRVRIDVQTATPGLIFGEAWARRETVVYEGQAIYIVSKTDLIASKKAAGRNIDLEDARLLELRRDAESQG